MTWDLIGHQWAVQLLQGHIKNDTLRHAYLITGPSEIGKRNLAIRFIQAICCPKPTKPGIPCLVCSTCSRIERLEHPDLFPISVQEGSKQIKIDQVREMIRSLSLSAYEAGRRFGLMLDFHKANRNTQNSLLKTLEEPPGSVILILTALSSGHLFDTVASRCEEVKLNPVPISTTQEGLELVHKLTPDHAELLAHISGGKPELALTYHQDPGLLESRESLLDQQMLTLGDNTVDRFLYASQISKDTKQVLAMVNTWSSIWIDVLHLVGKSDAPLHNVDRLDDIQKIADLVDLQDAKRIINHFQKAADLLNINANLKLTVENLFLQLPTI